jgi:glycosyltransferase involved in cell wall biosynthesis
MGDLSQGMPSQRTCLLVLGMHRSGTSAITRILNLMGAALPKQLVGALPGNEAGHWEPKRLVLLHDQMLAEAGSSWRDLRPFDPTKLTADRLEHYKTMIRSIIQDDFGDARVFVLKDPRICRIIPIYLAVLSELNVTIHPIIMIRDPLEVAASLSARNKISNAYGLLLWLSHCLDAEKYTRDISRIFVSYDSIVNDVVNVTALLRKFLDEHLPFFSISQDVDNLIRLSIRRDLRHQVSLLDDDDKHLSAKTWINETYRAFQELLAKRGENLATAHLDRISREFSNAVPLIAQLADDVDALRMKEEQFDDNQKIVNQLRDQVQRNAEQHVRDLQRNAEQHVHELQRNAERNAELHAQEVKRNNEKHTEEIRRNAEQQAREIQQNTERYARKLAGLQLIDYDRRLPPELTGLRQWLSKRRKQRRMFVKDYHTIAASPLFDRDWYLQKNPDVAATKANAALHYLQRGGLERRAPGPYFRANIYVQANPDVAAAGANPLLHFIGRYKDGRLAGEAIEKDHIFSDENIEKDRSFADEAIERDRSFTEQAIELIRRSPLFDSAFYLTEYPDLAAAGVDPAAHYFLHGGEEGRNPGPYFSTSEYLRQNPEVAAASLNALYHYESRGREEGRLLPYQQMTMSVGALGETTDTQGRLIEALDCYSYITCHPELEIPLNAPLDVSVSVVIPTYNAGSEFRPLLRKLLSQKGLKSIEVVIVDSGSTDGTAELSVQLGCKVVRISQSEFSHSHSRNVGADASTGELLVFMVQDAYPIGEYWLFGLARCLFSPQVKGAQLSAVSCAEYPRTDSEIFYDILLKGHYDFIGCSDKDRVGYFRSDDQVDLHSQGQLSDVTCAISKRIFSKYRFIGQYAEDLTLGIRLIRDGYLVGMLSSIRVIHSHRRKSAYYLRRSFVDVVFLCEIFQDRALPEDNCLLGTLTCSLLLWNGLKPIAKQDTRSPAKILEDYIAEVRQINLPDRVHSLKGCNGFGYARLSSWIDSVNRAAIDHTWSFDELSLRSVRQTRMMFIDRLSSLLPSLRIAYPMLDDVVAVELSDAIQKALAMTIGAQLAYCCLRPRRAVEDRQLEELLRELRPIMMAGI